MAAIGIERLCVFGMPPPAFVALAAEVGAPFIGIGTRAMRSYVPDGFADWSLIDDVALRRETAAVLRDTGVGIGLLEGFAVGDTADAEADEAALDMLAQLGGARINAASMDRDRARVFDGFAMLAERAVAYGIEVVIEIGPGPVATLPAALDAVTHVGRSNFRLLLDTMHFFRFGGTVQTLTDIDPALIGYVQLCDVPDPADRLASGYMDEALHERLPPGRGVLPLAATLALLRADVPISIEVPQRSLAEMGIGPRARVADCMAAARVFIAAAASQADQPPSTP